MNPETTCQTCGRPLRSDAPHGLCPECLIRGGLGTGAKIDPATTEPDTNERKASFVPPSAEEMANRFPHLEVLEFVGQGGMGAVYKVRQKQLDRTVALKILPPAVGHDTAFSERFAREAKAMAKLSHPGIVTIHDFGQTGDLYYLVMEYVDGVNLAELSRNRRVAPREALEIVPQICDALEYAHDQGIVHRDIKPENILLDRRGRVKVADFGLAKLMGFAAESGALSFSSSGTSSLTDAGSVMGTPQYMAPEQRERPLEVDHRADVYSLGVVLYQLLTGELPHKPIEPPSRRVKLDVRLDEVVLRALEENPERRFQNVSELKTGVETVAVSGVESKGGAPASSQPQDAAGALRRVPWQIWIVVVFLALEGLGNLTAIPQNPIAATWLAAKCLFVVGLLKRWRWVFVWSVLEAAFHVYTFLPINVAIAVINLVLVALTASAWRFYFPPSGRETTSAARRVLLPVLIALVVFAVWKLLTVSWFADLSGTESKADSPRQLESLDRQFSPPPGEQVFAIPKGVPIGERKPDNPGMEEGEDAPASLEDVADISCEEFTAAAHERMRYFLIGPKADGNPPPRGYKLLVVLPGGDGGAGFNPFVRRILKNGLSADYLVAQPLAFKWQSAQRIVWPTRESTVEGQEFSTEDFVKAVVRDVGSRHSLDERRVFSLSWSSGGPAGYAVSLADDAPITGSYMAMAVFKPESLPPLENAAGQAYFIDHSVEDRLCPFFMAEKAAKSLEEHGAAVRLNTYRGGHGWRGDVYGRIREGIDWLEGVAAEEE